jgi:hypothetical protein
MLSALLAVALGAIGPRAQAQAIDTLFTWKTYDAEGITHIRVFPSDDEDRPITAVVDELAENRAGAVTDDVRYFVDTFGRAFGFDPAEITFVFRFSGASFHADGDDEKQLLLRATFNRTKAGNLGSPSWRLISRDELAELTDRALY